MQTKYWPEKRKERNHTEDQQVARRSMCRSIPKKQYMPPLVYKLDQWRALMKTGMTVRIP
jgi:hypothetical protein